MSKLKLIVVNKWSYSEYEDDEKIIVGVFDENHVENILNDVFIDHGNYRDDLAPENSSSSSNRTIDGLVYELRGYVDVIDFELNKYEKHGFN